MEEPIEIVKRIPSPNDKTEKENLHHIPIIVEQKHTHPEKTSNPSKKPILSLLAISTIGVIGYLGFTGLEKESKSQPSNSTIVKTDTNHTKTVLKSTKEEPTKIVEPPKEENNYYIEALAIPKKPIEIEKKQPLLVSTPTVPIEKKEPVALVSPIEVSEPIVKVIKTIQPEKIEPKEIVATEVIKKVKKEQPSIIKYETIKPRILTVRAGDTLASISKRFYGNPMEFKRIIRANRRLKSQKTALRLGEKIVIPRKDKKKTRRFIIVKKGNTLASISRKVYGNSDKILKIVRANYKIKSKNSTLRLGQKVYVPR